MLPAVVVVAPDGGVGKVVIDSEVEVGVGHFMFEIWVTKPDEIRSCQIHCSNKQVFKKQFHFLIDELS